MRQRLLTIVGTTALALAGPSAALAHRGHGHHHHHRDRGHHARFHVVNIGASNSTPSGTPGTPSEENAGTVASYEKEVLTLTLKDGSMVSGKVTGDTHIRCISPNATSQPADEGPGDDNGQGDDQGGGDMNQSGGQWQGHGGRGDDFGGDNGQQGSHEPPEPPCDSSSLVKGAVVRSAQLRIGPSGNEFDCILLVRTTTPTGPTTTP